ncbi:hypothetical protein [Capnocytophaga catalasegens]|uniref:Uncharacterized protein n=1 Tax=Capnocytophaga catalasegens TaxID=1004260 RepID=A0AAV5AR95_9FLAO|nr:hypothetical protein [Capnocytophaga catalasegens]GIZ15500.1 hypothetical protein RCZ03_15000 [Capnocytophaga catalasegens]GJM49843.1 hypothetical protein RCZ15_08180 [Capnocytophaga catalasegens]GJM54015.1 hypothetical protein RCZ16_23310 [Capnocytophaga catalasegens]
MPAKRITPKSQIDKHLESEIKKREQKLIRVLNYIGMTCISEARNSGDYIDRTGNLRSSIGYAILNNGKIEKISSFQTIKKGTKGKEKGNEIIKNISSDFNYGIILIVVAGMNYAAYLETKRNVLSSSELYAKQQAQIILTRLGFIKK